MSTIKTNRISSNELGVDFVINNTKFITLPFSPLEKKINRNVLQNNVLNVCYNSNSKNYSGTKISIEVCYTLLKFINKKKDLGIIGVWKQKNSKIIQPPKPPEITFYITKEYDPYDAPVKNSLVVIDEKIKVPIPKHPMDYNIFSNGFNRFFTNKYFKKYF